MRVSQVSHFPVVGYQDDFISVSNRQYHINPVEQGKHCLKLPQLSNGVGTSPSDNHEDNSFDGNTRARANTSRPPEDAALGILHQYNRLIMDESKEPSQGFPQIKISIRPSGCKPAPTGSRFTTVSLDHVEQGNKTLFTEGLSSISRKQEASLTMRRRDILGANMPETVRVARERSKVCFKVNNSKRRGGTSGRTTLQPARTTKALGSCFVSSISKHADQPPFKVEKIAEEKPQNTAISSMLKKMELKYGKTLVPTTPRPTPAPKPRTPIDIPTGLSSVSTSGVTVVRSKPIKEKRRINNNLSVVSLCPKVEVKTPKEVRLSLPAPGENILYNQIERFKQNKLDRKINHFEMSYNAIRDQKPKVSSRDQHNSLQDLRLKKTNKLKYDNRKQKQKAHSLLLMNFDDSGYFDVEVDKDTISSEPRRLPNGSFQFQGVQGVAAVPRVWSAASSSTGGSILLNPPPSIAASIYEDDVIRTREPTVMLTVEEEDNDAHLKKQIDNTEAHLSNCNASSASSNFLTVPSIHTRVESRPTTHTVPEVSEVAANHEEGVGRTIATQTTDERRGHTLSLYGDIADDGRKIKVKTLELFPSQQLTAPIISISDEDEVEDSIKKGKTLTENQTVANTGLPSTVHSKTITFISPLQIQGNAKRQ